MEQPNTEWYNEHIGVSYKMINTLNEHSELHFGGYQQVDERRKDVLEQGVRTIRMHQYSSD